MNCASGHVCCQVGDLGGAGDGDDVGASLQQPSERNLAARCPIFRRHAFEDRARSRQIAGSKRVPRNEAYGFRLTVIENLLAAAVDKIVEVLHTDDLEKELGCLNVRNADLAQTGVANEPLLYESADCIELLIARYFRVDPVQLPEVDPVDAQTPDAHEDRLAQVFRPSELNLLFGSSTHESAFGSDHQAIIGVQRLADEHFADMRPVGVGRVYKVKAKFSKPTKNSQALLGILWLPPDAGAGQAHRAKAETIDRDITADREFSGQRCIKLSHRRCSCSQPSFGSAEAGRLITAQVYLP